MKSEKPSETWLLLQSGDCPPAANMAIDEALLHGSGRLGCPILRFYGWAQPAVTFGYSQRFALVESWTECRPIIRRPTGGGLVLHQSDWTYSVAIPRGHPWYALKAAESYFRMHEWIHRAFARLGIVTTLCAVPEKLVPGQCFLAAEVSDLLLDKQKIAGAAQRRNRQGLLIQGSVQVPRVALERSQWERAMCLEVGHAEWLPFDLDPPLRAYAAELAERKYSSPAYNAMR